MLYLFSYEDSELNDKDLIVYFTVRGFDEVRDFTIKNFVPKDYALGYNGDNQEEIYDYYPQDWFEETVTKKDLKQIVKDFEKGCFLGFSFSSIDSD